MKFLDFNLYIPVEEFRLCGEILQTFCRDNQQVIIFNPEIKEYEHSINSPSNHPKNDNFSRESINDGGKVTDNIISSKSLPNYSKHWAPFNYSLNLLNICAPITLNECIYQGLVVSGLTLSTISFNNRRLKKNMDKRRTVHNIIIRSQNISQNYHRIHDSNYLRKKCFCNEYHRYCPLLIKYVEYFLELNK